MNLQSEVQSFEIAICK